MLLKVFHHPALCQLQATVEVVGPESFYPPAADKRHGRPRWADSWDGRRRITQNKKIFRETYNEFSSGNLYGIAQGAQENKWRGEPVNANEKWMDSAIPRAAG